MACYFKNSNPSTIHSDGSCCKVCVETKRVFDACISRQNESLTLTVDFGSESAVSIASVASVGESTITSLVITPLAGSDNSRVEYSVASTLSVVGTNAQGNTIVGSATATFNKDLVLKVPQTGIIIPEIEASVAIEGLQSTVVSGNVVTTNACVTIITKVVAEVILVIPSYGYLTLPPCQEYTQDVCTSVFNTPVFPR